MAGFVCFWMKFKYERISKNPATSQNNNHRKVSISASATNATNNNSSVTKVKTPKALTLSYIQDYAVSFHPQVSTTGQIYGTQFVDTLHKLKRKETRLSKMEEMVDFNLILLILPKPSSSI